MNESLQLLYEAQDSGGGGSKSLILAICLAQIYIYILHFSPLPCLRKEKLQLAKASFRKEGSLKSMGKLALECCDGHKSNFKQA